MTDTFKAHVEAQKYKLLKQDLITRFGLDAGDPALLDTLDGECNLKEVLVDLIVGSQNDQDCVDAIERRQEAQDARKGMYKLRAQKKRDAVFAIMQEAGINKLPSAEFTIWIGETQPKVTITDISKVPVKFLRISEPKPDLRAIREAIEDGQAIEGAVLSNGGQTLFVR